MCDAMEHATLAEQLIRELVFERRNIVQSALLDGQVRRQRPPESDALRCVNLFALVALQQTRNVVVHGELEITRAMIFIFWNIIGIKKTNLWHLQAPSYFIWDGILNARFHIERSRRFALDSNREQRLDRVFR